MSSDASLAEINPLAVLGDGTLQALDGKMVLDDSALFRHADLAAMRDEDEETAGGEGGAAGTASATSSSTARSAAW